MTRTNRRADSMPAMTKEVRDYWDAHPIGAEVLEEEAGSPEFYRRYIEYYDRFYAYKKRVFQYEKYRGLKVLEIGCGLGIDSYKFAKAGAVLTCIDLSSVAVQGTRRLLQQLGLQAEVLECNAEQLVFPDESFDAVYSFGVLHHVEHEERAFNEVYRVLKPGGEALITLYHSRSWFWLLKRLSGTNVESEAGDPPFARVYSVPEVRELFRDYSQAVVQLERFPQRTRRREGLKAFLFNWVFVPATKALPRRLIRPFGWHLVVKAVK